jgi:hypothetical protein
MAGNTTPIFSRIGAIGGIGSTTLATVSAADYTGVGAQNILVFTSDATNGGFVQRIRLKAIGTNVASVARIYINNGSTNGTATNNVFYGEISLPATTAATTAATVDVDYPLNIALPAGYKLYVGLGATVAAGWVVSVIAGAY